MRMKNNRRLVILLGLLHTKRQSRVRMRANKTVGNLPFVYLLIGQQGIAP
jgi:hypothetical protein